MAIRRDNLKHCSSQEFLIGLESRICCIQFHLQIPSYGSSSLLRSCGTTIRRLGNFVPDSQCSCLFDLDSSQFSSASFARITNVYRQLLRPQTLHPNIIFLFFSGITANTCLPCLLGWITTDSSFIAD